MRDLMQAVRAALERGEHVALITAVRSVGSTPRHNAARLAVFEDGDAVGSIGGGTMERQAVADAREALASGQPRLVEYSLIGRGSGNLGLCGGTQEVFIDILEPGRAAAQWRVIGEALSEGDPCVLAVVVRSAGDELRPGTRQVIRGETGIGSLGDAGPDLAVEARRVMAEHYPARLGFDPTTGATHRLASTRRAPVEIYLDLFDPRPRLLIVGAGHIGAALARQAKFLDWHVQVVDDRAEFLAPDHLPNVDATHLVAYDAESERLGPLDVRITPGTAVVVATWGWDEPALGRLAGAPAFYIGLVASLRKATVILDALRTGGIDPEWLNAVRAPVGLDIGAESPEEIALAIIAEILAAQRGKSGRPLREVRGERLNAWMGGSWQTERTL